MLMFKIFCPQFYSDPKTDVAKTELKETHKFIPKIVRNNSGIFSFPLHSLLSPVIHSLQLLLAKAEVYYHSEKFAFSFKSTGSIQFRDKKFRDPSSKFRSPVS